MKSILKITLATLTIGLLAGCSSTFEQTIDKRETQTFYDAAGKVERVVVVETGVKSLEEITNAKAMSDALKIDGSKLSERSVDLTNFNFGESGLKWFSLSLNSVQAPASPETSDKVLQGVAISKQASKTTFQTSNIGVNTPPKEQTDTK